jgi:hypothetical protein
VRAGCDLGADLGQVQVHRLGVDERQHEGGADATGRADGTEQIRPVVTLIARCAGAAAPVCPDVGQAALLTDAGFILPPEFDRLAARLLRDRGRDQFSEVYGMARPSLPGKHRLVGATGGKGAHDNADRGSRD